VRTNPKYGNIYDHFGVVYDWADGTQGFLQTRQQNGCHGENLDRVVGSKAIAHIDGWQQKFAIRGTKSWDFAGESNDMYQTEHDELFASIRSGLAMNQGDEMVQSTVAALMGRMSAYTGQRITYQQAFESQENLLPKEWAFGEGIDVSIAMPGRTKFL